MTTTRWGILGPGRIAHSFAADLSLVPGAEMVAVGSRSIERAREFATTYGGATAYGSYEELLADERVDAVYVASPHGVHVEHVTLALEAGKPVLCEKPLTLRTSDAEALFALATARGLLLMEAMWTACHPVVRAVQAGFAEGRFGTPHHLHAELGFVVDTTSSGTADSAVDRLLDPALGSGALLDMGIYPLTFAHLVLGEAEQVTATGSLSESGIDLDVAIAGRYPGGALATMTASMTSWSSRRGDIATDRGRLVLEDFHHPASAVFTETLAGGYGRETRQLEPVVVTGAEPVLGRGYAHEAIEFARCLRDGLLESPLVPHAQTLAVLRQMDAVRAQIGVRYLGD